MTKSEFINYCNKNDLRMVRIINHVNDEHNIGFIIKSYYDYVMAESSAVKNNIQLKLVDRIKGSIDGDALTAININELSDVARLQKYFLSTRKDIVYWSQDSIKRRDLFMFYYTRLDNETDEAYFIRLKNLAQSEIAPFNIETAGYYKNGILSLTDNDNYVFTFFTETNIKFLVAVYVDS